MLHKLSISSDFGPWLRTTAAHFVDISNVAKMREFKFDAEFSGDRISCVNQLASATQHSHCVALCFQIYYSHRIRVLFLSLPPTYRLFSYSRWQSIDGRKRKCFLIRDYHTLQSMINVTRTQEIDRKFRSNTLASIICVFFFSVSGISGNTIRTKIIKLFNFSLFSLWKFHQIFRLDFILFVFLRRSNEITRVSRNQAHIFWLHRS